MEYVGSLEHIIRLKGSVYNDDYFCRFGYKSVTGAFILDRVAVFHPACIEMTPEEAKQMEHFYCGNCSTEEQKLLQNAHANATSRHTDTNYQGNFLSFNNI
ncbi:putative Zinc finger, FYVE/PHD-type, Zinc finger, RING/FYVE/PHD-type [Helianthus anomalus]